MSSPPAPESSKELETTSHTLQTQRLADECAPLPCSSVPASGEKVSSAEDEWSTDLRNPANWPSWRKWTIVTLYWAANVVTAIASTSFEPALTSILRDLGTSDTTIAPLLISIYVVGYCLGPLVIAPISELWGRIPVLYPGFVLYLACLAICGVTTNIAIFIVFRAVMGFAGITFLICARGFIADVIPAKRRGIAVSFMTSGPTLGPTLGPVIGGYISQYLGWRWNFWISILVLGVLMLAFIPVQRETFPPLVKARLSGKDGGWTHTATAIGVTPSEALYRACTRPLRFIFHTRLVPIFTLYTSIVNSYLFIFLATLGTTFESAYGFSTDSSGLAYLGMLVGFTASQVTIGLLSDAIVARRSHPTPEDRLAPLIIGAALLPGALLLYGWAIEKHLHWIVPIIGSGLVGFAAMYSYIPVQIYAIDVYTLHAASAVGAMTIIRSTISAVVPLAADPLHERLGYGWGYTLLAGLSLPFLLGAVALKRYGAVIRAKDKEMR